MLHIDIYASYMRHIWYFFTGGTLRGLNGKIAAITAKPRNNRFKNARNRFRRPNLVVKHTFHAKNVLLVILTNFNAVLNKRGWVALPKGWK